jgi:hypothetical protein
MPMSESRTEESWLAEVHRRSSEATGGPWHVRRPDDGEWQCAIAICTVPEDPRQAARARRDWRLGWPEPESVVAITLLQSPRLAEAAECRANAEFIAAARVDVPRLLALAEGALGRLAEIRSLLAQACESIGGAGVVKQCLPQLQAAAALAAAPSDAGDGGSAP